MGVVYLELSPDESSADGGGAHWWPSDGRELQTWKERKCLMEGTAGSFCHSNDRNFHVLDRVHSIDDTAPTY